MHANDIRLVSYYFSRLGDDEHEPVPELQDVDGSEDEEPEAQG